MPPRRWDIRVRDILAAIEKINEYTKGYDLQNFEGDSKTIDAVVRNLEIIGEAARHIPDDIIGKIPDKIHLIRRGTSCFSPKCDESHGKRPYRSWYRRRFRIARITIGLYLENERRTHIANAAEFAVLTTSRLGFRSDFLDHPPTYGTFPDDSLNRSF